MSSRTPYPVTQPRPNRPRITSHTSNITIPQALLCPAAWQRRSRQLRSQRGIRGGLLRLAIKARNPADHAAKAAAPIAQRPALIVKPATDAMRDHRTRDRSRWLPGTERCRSRRSANDGSAAVPFNHSSAIAWTARYKRRTEAKSFAGWPPDRSGSREV